MLDLPQKLEAAAAKLIGDAGIVPVFTGFDLNEQTSPRCIISALSGNEMPQGSGNFMIQLSVSVLVKSDDNTVEEDRTLCQSAIGIMMMDNIAELLSAAVPDFHCFGFTNRQCRESVEDRSWMTEFTADMYCAGLVLV